ncbi:MAG: hypothetical protein HKN68_06140 [Saprospiraceae bacterium]|nr:hypothetical protein [Saprospiraceae bacterium]
MIKRYSLILVLFFLALFDGIYGQDNVSFDALQYRLVGPSRGGRVTAVAGTVHEPGTFYMGATGGGVWKTTDFGTSWKNISDGFFESPSIGDISVASTDPNIIYVGTGSDGLRSNVIAGKGVYKSVDAGKTWMDIGLKNTGHIGAVEIHPDNYNVVYVAAIGDAFQPTQERGLFKTTNGGMTWDKVLYISDKSGVSDVEMLPGNPEIVFATAWKAERKPWTILSGGENEEGGLYKSVDGGKNWNKITNGLPTGLIGKIDLAVCKNDSKVIYALVEAPGEEGGMYRSDDQGHSFKHVSNYGGIRTRPFYYTNVDVDPINPDIVYVMATGYFKSTDGGKNWSRMRPPHGDNHDMWINPENPDLFIQANDGGANVTHNGGLTWSTQHNQPTAELYQVEVDDQYPYWLYAGQQDNYTTIAVPSFAPTGVQDTEMGWVINTGGCETGPAVPKPGNHNIVYSNCKGRFSVFDKRTGLELSYDVGAANMYGHNPKELKFRFQRVAPIHVSPHDPGIVYHASQYVHKTTDEGKTWEIISPDLTGFEEDKQVISGSPITRDITGEEFYSTIYSIRESPITSGLIWVGANDGPVHVTRDGGVNWEKVTPSGLPPNGRVDSVEPSPHQASKAYISVLRYQLGDWKPYIYRTNDYGKSWTLLTDGNNGIPADHPVRVVREDPDREGLLYAGTEYGIFVSMDDGKTWHSFQQNFPVTPVTDMKVHRKDLVISTMGRSFWILDDLSPLHDPEYSEISGNKLFKPRDAMRYRYPKGRGSQYPRPAANIHYALSDDVEGPVKMEILNDEGIVVNTFYSSEPPIKENKEGERDMSTENVTYTINRNLKATPGLHRFKWNMEHMGPWSSNKSRSYQGGPMVRPGMYTIKLHAGDDVMEQYVLLKQDPRVLEMGITMEDIVVQEKLALELVDLISSARKWTDDLKRQKKKLSADKEAKEVNKEKITSIEGLLEELETAQGTYMKPMLLSQMNYLYNVVEGPDHRPGKDAFVRFEELKSKYNELKSQNSRP